MVAVQERKRKRSAWKVALGGGLIMALALGGAIAALVGLRSTATPAAAAPAAVIGWAPGVTRGVPLAAPISVYFSRAMDHASVQRAWRLTPSVQGSFQWSASGVTFHAAAPLTPGAYYRLSIGRAARDDQNRRLSRPFSVAFATGDALKAVGETPAAGTAGVPSSTLIAVTFNHPMVALAGLGVQVKNPGGWHVSISPHIPGRGSWLGASTWVFHPASGLLPSSDYTVTVSGQAQDIWGLPLGHDLSWSFSTIRPVVIDESPVRGSSTADPSGPVSVTFNQPMDAGSTAQAFSLSTGGAAVPGSTSWTGNTLQFQPAMPLDPSRLYAARVSRAALSATGGQHLAGSVSWTFHVAPPPRVVSSTPTDGATAAQSYVEIHFSAPMNVPSLDKALAVTPSLAGMSTYGSGRTYSISGDFQPSTAYTVSLAPGAVDRYGRTMQAAYTLRFTTAPIPPSAILYGTAGAGTGVSISAGRSAQAPLQVINVPWVHYTLVRTSLGAIGSQSQFGSNVSVPKGTTVRSATVQAPHPLNRVENLTVPLTNGDGTPLAPGLYWLGVQGPHAGQSVPASSEMVAVTDAGVTLKVSQNRALVWVTSARTGSPLAGETVRLVDSNGRTLASGATDAQGVHMFSVSQLYNLQAAVATGSDFGLAMTGWQPDTRTAAGFPVSSPYQGPQANGRYVYTDRPIYRPGQTVHFRAILWRDRDGVYSSLGNAQATVTASDGDGRTLYRRSLTLDSFGSVHGDVVLPSHAGTGYGTITVARPGSRSNEAVTGFAIADYRKPEFLTSVSTSRPSYAGGQTVDATVKVAYVFGAAAAGQQVSWGAYSQPRFTQPPGWDGYQFGDLGALQQWYMSQPLGFTNQGVFGSPIVHGSGTTDGSGRLAVRVPVNLGPQALDQTITIEASSTDINNQTVTGRVQVAALKSSEQIGIAPAAQVLPVGRSETVSVATVTARGATIKHASLTATVYRRTYTSELGGGTVNGSLWKQVPHDAHVSSQSLTTDGRGQGSFSFTPASGGDYYVVVTGSDSAGNTARSAVFIYASAAGFSDWGASSSTTIALQPDRSMYRVGQTARVLVAAPFAGATALVTTERGGIRSYRVEHLASASPTINIPVSVTDIPDIYVTVTLYRGWHGSSPPAWRYGVAELKVNTAPRRLVVHLSQDRSRYRPGQMATYTVTTRDSVGRPVSAEVSLALVDTAVLALQSDTNPDILTALYGDRPLGVSTTSSGVASIDGLQQAAAGRVYPPGGLGGGGGGNAPSTVYRRFRDTGYWRADLVTGRAGQATVRVRLPDNFTTWRLDARGVTAGYQVGQATLRTLSTRDLVVRPVTPRFFLQGDSLRIGAVVNNEMPRPLSVRVSLRAAGLTVASGTRTVMVPASGERLVTWRATVPESSRAAITFSAAPHSGSGYSVRVFVPIHPPLTEETVATSGQVFGSTKDTVILPQNASSRLGSLTVQVASSLTGGLGRSYAVFAPSRYESNDDVAARLMAASALHRLPGTLTGLPMPANRRLPADIAAAARTLAARQLGDGGWPWFSGAGATSDPLISADVVLALSGAGQQAALGRGRRYLESQLAAVSPDERAFLLMAIARSGTPDAFAAETLFHDSVTLSHLSPGALADLSSALAASGDRSAARTLRAQLDSETVVSPTGANWEAAGLDGGTAADATAHVLSALVAQAPNDPYVPAAARWLMLARTGQGWDTERDSALAVSALSAFARSAREGHASYTYRVAVDGTTALQRTVTRAGSSAAGVTVPAARLHHGGSSFSIARLLENGSVGRGPLYYVAQLRYFLPAASIAPLDQGVSVSRRYLDFAGHTVTSVPPGSVVQVELSVSTGRTLSHLRVDDPIPSGFEPIDQSLNTSRQGLFKAWQPVTLAPGVANLSPYLAHTDLRDDRVSLYAESLPPGTYRFAYLAQATVSGRYAVAPARASEAFFPEVFGRSGGVSFTVG